MGRRARILHVGPDPARPGGMASVTRTLMASALADRYAMDVLPTWRSEASVRRQLVFARALPALVLWCLRPGPRLAHVHTAVRGSLYRKAVVVGIVRAFGHPVILHLHAGAGDVAAFAARLGYLRRALLRAAFARANRVVSVSAAGAREIERRFGARGVLVVPNPAPAVDGSAVRAAGEPVPGGSTPRVLYLGGFADPAKGGAVLVDALPSLLEADERVRVDLAGPGEPPATLRALVAREPRVHWRGWLEEDALAGAYRAADAVVLPSLSEGLPIVLLEAMAHGRAVVATRVGGMLDVLTDGVDALLVTPGDPAALSRALRALAGDAPARRRLGAAARARTARLNETEVLAPLARLYRELTGGSARGPAHQLTRQE